MQYASGPFDLLKAGSNTKPAGPRRFAGRILAAFLALQILFLSAMAASPTLHRAIHHDADSSDHECAVTLFVHGQVNAGVTVPVVAVVAALFGGDLLLPRTFVFAQADYRYSASRAPPLALLCH